MNTFTHLRRSGLAFVFAFAITSPAFAQNAPNASAPNDVATLAAALVRAQAPATDDPDAVANDLVAAALAQPRSPVAALLVAEAGRWIGQLQDPAALLQRLDRTDAAATGTMGERRHGLLVQECAVLRWRLHKALSQVQPRFPIAGHAESLLACGPFGDAGDSFAGVVFPPELQYPTAGQALAGRGEAATCQVRTRTGDSRRIDLALPPRRSAGCYYGRWQVAAAAEVDGFLEVEHDSDCQVFVDGREIFRLERWRRSAPARHHIGLRLPIGNHTVVVKTTTNGRSLVGLRFVDAEGTALAGVTTATDLTRAPADAATATGASFVTGEGVLARLAGEPNADATLAIAAVLAAVRDGNGDLAIDLAAPLQERPPTAAEPALAWARVLRLLPFPDEFKKAQARSLEEPAIAALLPAHHTARLVQAAHAEEQDQREDALRLLGQHPQPGPETFARRVELARQLHFDGEVAPLLRAWAEHCPRDSRPWAQLAGDQHGTRASAALLTLRRRSLVLRPDQPSLAMAACRDALALGQLDVAQLDVARELLELAYPNVGDPPSPARLRLEIDVATIAGDAAAVRRLRNELAAHPIVDANGLLDLAAAWHRDGDQTAAADCVARARRLDGDRPAVLAWQALTGGPPAPIDELQTLRRDGRAAALAFHSGEREQGASMTVLIDQRILVMNSDGSWTTEGHELRRINDQAGVEAFAEKIGLAGVDEVLLVRTLAADGTESVPARIDGDYALTRLQPGAFVEWRYRQHGQAPGPDVVSTTEYLFGSADEPVVLAELAVVLPTGRGELRTRGLAAPTMTTTLADGRTVHTWTRNELPSLAKERFLPSLFELLPCAQVGEDPAPWSVHRDQRVQLGSRTRALAPLRATAQQVAGNITTPRGKADAIWQFCHEQIEDGNAENALETLLRKKGNRFLLAVALLRAAGLQVDAMASTDTAPWFESGPSSLFIDNDALQFPAALLTLPDGTRLPLFLDTPRHWPLGQVPAQRAGTSAVVIHDGIGAGGDGVETFVLPQAPFASQDIRVRGQATLRDKDLVLTATVTLGDLQGFALAERLRQLPENNRKLAARQITQQLFPGFRVDAARIGAGTPGQPLVLEATVKRTGVQKNGDRYVVPLPMPVTKFAGSFGDREGRTLPWSLPIDLASDWVIEMDAGTALRVVGLPANVDLRCEPLHFQQQVTTNGEKLVIRRQLRVGAATRPAIAFGDWLRALADADRAELATIELVAKP